MSLTCAPDPAQSCAMTTGCVHANQSLPTLMPKSVLVSFCLRSGPHCHAPSPHTSNTSPHLVHLHAPDRAGSDGREGQIRIVGYEHALGRQPLHTKE